jgi:hypothetical protein
MPVVSLLVLYLPWRTALGLNALLAAFVCVVLARTPARGDALAQAIAGELSAFAFVMVFSLLARRERYTRQAFERLAARSRRSPPPANATASRASFTTAWVTTSPSPTSSSRRPDPLPRGVTSDWRPCNNCEPASWDTDEVAGSAVG